MKLEVNRLVMLEAAKNAARVAPTKSPVEILNGILIESNGDAGNVFLTATNLEASIQQKLIASVGRNGTMLVPARIFANILPLLPGEFVSFEATGANALKVAGGKCVYEINCLPAKNYPRPVMPFPEETAVISGICSLAGRTAFAVAKDGGKPVLQCVNVKLKNNAVHATACDGVRIMLAKSDAEKQGSREFLLLGRSLQMLASMSADDDVFEVGDTGKEIVFMRGDMMFNMKKIPGEYIDVNKVVKSITPVYTAVTDANQLKDALNSVTAGMDSEPVHLVMGYGEIHLRCTGKDGEAHTAVQANIQTDMPEAGFYYNADNLYKLLQIVTGRIRVELDAKGTMMVKTANEVYVQLSQRAPVKKKTEAA
jgi:DNA polymerase III sliding clamp (beta) subunit (PCNA family)